MSAKDEILNSLKTLYKNGDIIEIRMMQKYGTTSGYYDYAHFEKCAVDVAKYDGLPDMPAIYHTVNVVKTELIARAFNRLVDKAKSTTSESDVLRRVYLPIDIDPVRPAGTSATDVLHDRSISKAKEVKEWLIGKGFPDMLLADSGNGAHLLIRIDQPNTPEVKTLIENVQKVIIREFNTPEVDSIDIQGFADANRIWKLYGTKTRKGDEVPDLNIKHRRSKVLYVPDNFETTTTAQLEVIAGMLEGDNTAEVAGYKPDTTKHTGAKFDLFEFMDKYGMRIQTTIPQPDKHRIMYRLEECPFNSEHKGKDSAIFQYDNGKLGFNCKHHSCEDKKWVDVRDLFEHGHKKRVAEYKAKAEAKPKNNTVNGSGVSKELFEMDNKERCTLNHIAVAEMLEDKYNVVAYHEALYVYDDGVYINGEEILQTEIANLSKQIGCKGSVRAPTTEIIHYLKFSNPHRKYPFNICDGVVNVNNGVVVINFENGTFELVKHDPKFRFNYKFDVCFNPDNKNDTIHTEAIMQYVEKIDIELLYQIPAQAILQMMGSDPFKKAYLIQGDMDAGKSAYLQILLRMFGDSTHSQVSLQALGKNRFALAELEGKILNVYDDLSNIPLNDAGVFKTLTGKREQRIERKYSDGYNAILSAVHVYTCNKPPEFDINMQDDTAFWGRWEYVRFINHFERDAFFYDRVFTPDNMECMFIKTLEHVVKIRKEGLKVNSTPSEVREKWCFNSDPLYQFITENMEQSERDITLNKNDFIAAYTRWCASVDVDAAQVIKGLNGFTTALFKYGFISRQLTANNVRSVYYQGAYKWRVESKFTTEALKTSTMQSNVM